MSLQITARKSLNKAYLKVKHTRAELELFKANLIILLEQINHAETEEFNKNVLADFLKNTFYSPNYFINTKGRNDLVIHNGKTASESVGVIIEAKRAINISEMLKKDNINAKALQELVLYYLRERITNKNLEVRNLIVTNVNEWYVFDANVFEKCFARNKKLVQQFVDFENGKLSGVTTDFFYKEIAHPFIQQVINDIEFTYFDIGEINTALRNSDKGDDTKLIPFLKLLSPEHLLKISFVNDSNSLNKSFYSELLHIIGLEEVKEGSKKIISRKKIGERDSGSLLENSIIQIQSLFRLNNVKNRRSYGETEDEQLFNVAIELVITWINRILFLKLLEAQLISYNKNDKEYEFLKVEKVKDYDELNTLFFQVLAVDPTNRNSDVIQKYSKVPYLNSSLFEPALIEQDVLFISNLSDDKKLPILTSTVLKEASSNKSKGDLNTLEYLFRFLDAYDFGVDTTEDIIESNKSLINASVLGLIFEKINGYKDGSFFTPSFVTMYMCRESIRKTLVNKVNKINGLNLTNILDIYNSGIDNDELSIIIDDIKVCDPAVGSGHFLVSALNEFISIKSELGLLKDKDGRRLKGYTFELLNDELIITDEDGDIFDYKKNNPESQRIQETLFNEKKKIIENCLFGVDINPNSVKICRLRLWIELLKNAYYKHDGQLETLPNIDINIKCGNSLISRFDLNTDLKEALKKSKLTIPQYKSAVNSYKNSKNKEEKWGMDNLINEVKSGFQTEILSNDKRVLDLYKFKNELNAILNQQTLFDLSAKEEKIKREKIEKLKLDITKLENVLKEIKSNKIYENAFEWRFEFPEVLNDDGDFLGFDVVVGNPPYIDSETMVNHGLTLDRNYITEHYKTASGNWDIYVPFFERGFDILRDKSVLAYISPDIWLSKGYGEKLRLELLPYIYKVVKSGRDVFESADLGSILTFIDKDNSKEISTGSFINNSFVDGNLIRKDDISHPFNLDFIFSNNLSLINKLETFDNRFKDISLCENACATSDCYTLADAIEDNADIALSDYFKIVNSGTIDKFFSKWGSKDMTYLKNKYNKPVVKKILFSNLFKNAYLRKTLQQKIIIKGLRNLDAMLDLTADFVPGKSTLIVTADNVDNLKLCTAIINSPLAIFYIKEKYSAATYNGGVNFTKDMINEFPFVNGEDDIKNEIVELVDFLLASNSTVYSDAIKNINQLVYKLYKLTDEEISLISLQ
ncbi:MAG: Eco57I restriction-modification methylase domain-containing protein [Methylotenera sp.]|nr:Eco57I restriction-modification methylase domain-containing protein [Methylotenera sp.]